MKRFIVAVAALALAACGPTPKSAHPHPDSSVHRDQVGDPCVVDGRSGYLISAGRDLVCSAS